MMKLVVLLLIIVTALFHALAGIPRSYAESSSISVSNTSNLDAPTCSQFRVEFDGRKAEWAEETIRPTRAELPELRTTLPSGSGIHVQDWDREEYAITLCKAAPVTGTLQAISLSLRDGRLVVDGPEKKPWVTRLLVRAPKGAGVDLEAENGPIDLRGVEGAVRARSVNGPLSVRQCGSRVEASTRNGPISFTGSAGSVDLRAENGPLTIELEGSAWKDGALNARTQNGPLSLTLSTGFKSGVQIDISENSPVSCQSAICDGMEKTRNGGGRLIRFGDPDPVIHLFTVNGPVSIQSTDRWI